MNSPIPSFKSPPLAEVLLSAQFEPIDDFKITTYGLLWERFKERFPTVEHHIALEPSFEKVGVRRQNIDEIARLKLESLVSPQLPRAWFVSKDASELIQVQPDRILRNWRRRKIADEYPRYMEHMRSEFLSNLESVDSFYRDHDMGGLRPNQCEISYINYIDTGKLHSFLGDAFLGWSSEYDLKEIVDVEDVQINVKHLVNDDIGDFVGRLYVKVQPAFRLSDDGPMFLIELTMRGRPLGDGLEGVMAFMDFGREKIVRAFTKMTTSEMHKLWRRER